MLSNIFGAKEEWAVEAITAFTDTYLGMAHDEHFRKIPVGAKGKATIAKNGNIVVTFDTLKDTPNTGKLRLYFKKEDEEYKYFNWTEIVKAEAGDSKIKKSSIFSK